MHAIQLLFKSFSGWTVSGNVTSLLTVVTTFGAGTGWTFSGNVTGTTTGITFAVGVQTVFGHVVWTTTFVAGNPSAVERFGTSAESLVGFRRGSWAISGNVTDFLAVVTFLNRTFGFDVAFFTTAVTLFVLDGFWLGAVGLDVTWLVTVVTQSFTVTGISQVT